eukprot:8930248-Pyramimonas_sp.AAC.1
MAERGLIYLIPPQLCPRGTEVENVDHIHKILSAQVQGQASRMPSAMPCTRRMATSWARARPCPCCCA